jgi:hypothetical protein
VHELARPIIQAALGEVPMVPTWEVTDSIIEPDLDREDDNTDNSDFEE